MGFANTLYKLPTPIPLVNVPVLDTSKFPAGSLMPAGHMFMTFATGAVPTGFIKANGAAVSRTTYAALFAAIGTAYGVGDGSTTFNVPDARGEFMRGLDDGRGIDPGRTIGSAQGEQLKAHTHTVAAGGTGGTSDPYGGTYNGAGSFNTGSFGGGETRPRNLAPLVLIKY